MNDLISRQAAIEAIRASTSKYTGFMEMEMYTDDDAVEAIEGLPSAVVRCKDCRWCITEEYGKECENPNGNVVGYVDDLDYCSYGERKDDETD